MFHFQVVAFYWVFPKHPCIYIGKHLFMKIILLILWLENFKINSCILLFNSYRFYSTLFYYSAFLTMSDNHSWDLQSSNCAKECQLNRANLLLKSFSKLTVKVRSIATFLLTNLVSYSSCSTRANIGKLHYTKRGCFN